MIQVKFHSLSAFSSNNITKYITVEDAKDEQK
jgi:hypothetical protein